MLKFKLSFLFLVAFIYSQAQIIPQPVSGNLKQGSFIVNQNTIVSAPDSLQPYASYLSEIISGPLGSDIAVSESEVDNNAISLAIDESLPEEGYTLLVTPETINIKGGDRAGVFYGIQSLLQLFPSEIYSEKKEKNV